MTHLSDGQTIGVCQAVRNPGVLPQFPGEYLATNNIGPIAAAQSPVLATHRSPPKKGGRDVDRTGNHSSCPGKTGTDALGVCGEPGRLQETEHAISHHSRL